MLKRALWLLSFVLLGWAIWRWWQDRTNDVFATTPQLASSVPPPDYASPSAPASPVPQAPPQPEPPAPARALPPAAAALEGGAAGPTAAPGGDQTTAPAEVALEVPRKPGKTRALGAPAQDGGQSAEDTTDTTEAGQTAAAASDAETDPAENEAEDETDGVITGYCVRCKAKRDMRDPQIETTENGRRAARGTCPVCEGTMFTFLKERAPGA